MNTYTEQDRYRLLVENITDYAIYMLDPSGHVTSWNAGAQRFKGYEQHEILGQHFSRFYTDEDRAAELPKRALEIAEREGRFEQEGWRVRKDGARFWANVVIDAIRRPSGELAGFAKITRDLTERKKAEADLLASEQQFRILVQGVTDYAIFMLDPEGRVANWNAGAERIKGYRPEEIIGEHFSKFYRTDDRANGLPDQALETALREGRYTNEAWRCRKDGTEFWASVVIDPIRAPDGTLLGFAKITRDITERREAEQALHKAQEALFQSQKMEAIGQLTGGVAHDFNNLLAAIIGSLELTIKRLPPSADNLLPLLNNAMQGAKRGASLTQRMLAFARKQDLKSTSLSLGELIEGLKELLQRSLGPGLWLENRITDTLPRVIGDANQIEMAIMNLVVNARDAMPQGGMIVIEGDAEKDQNGRDLVRLAVIDDGEGMDPATLAKATEPFFTTKGVGRGTGLGLSMVKGLAEQLGGHLRLSSELGSGTRAELVLPAASQGASKGSLGNAAVDAKPDPSLRILAVDDDPLVLLNTVMVLEELGHEVAQATSGPMALKIIESETDFDLLMTDQVMPKMTGTELIKVAKARQPHLKLIIATGYSELPRSPDVPFVKLRKPFLERELASAIRSAVKST